MLRQVLREHGSRCEHLAWIDLHTGLGPSGVGERIFACADDKAALQRARTWWGPGITSIYDGSSTSASARASTTMELLRYRLWERAVGSRPSSKPEPPAGAISPWV